MRALIAAFAALSCAAPRDEGLAPWASDRHPTDAPKRHVEEIASGKHAYAVQQGGTMDGTNCRSPQGVWTPFEQTWESNRSVRMENVGETDVVNPWLSNGRNDFRTIDEIIARAVAPGMSAAEKAMALWWQQVQHRFHFQGDNDELMEPTKIFNVYGHNTCGNDSIGLAGLWRKAGLKVAPARLVGHCVSQAFYDGRWHLFDGDMQSIYLLRDNETVAGEQDLVRDHDLLRRTHTQGILHPESRAGDEWESSIYVFEGEVTGDRNCRGDSTMNMTLRPGEALTWRWGRLDPAKVHRAPPKFPDRICNGLWEYAPDFTRETWRRGAAVEGIRATDRGLAAEEGKTGAVTWTLRSPYVFVGGRLTVEGSGARFSLSWDGKTWEQIGKDFDTLFAPGGPARYAYHLKCELSGDSRLKRLSIANDLQMAPLALPAMIVGKNAFTYTDQSTGGRKVRISHDWVERSASKPPEAPPAEEYPPHVGEAEGTDILFRWKPPADADGDKIADYHFELSARADMRWPLSMSFAKLISRTSDAGKAQYTVPGPGLLTPDRPYFWHVRAKDEKGVWGPWSATWSFMPRGPAPPLEVALDHDPGRGVGTLRWKPNPVGRKPVKYRIYASDEKGFSVSDEPYKVTVGVSKELSSPFPANFVAETQASECATVGRAFYRVVAVDAQGRRSGPSDYVAAPRPVITSTPVTEGTVGEGYRYPLAAIRSLGDLRTRVVNGKETMGFWDIETPRFAMQRGPAWLNIDEKTGVLSGTPDAAVKAEVEVVVTLERELRKLDEAVLKWGNEKIIASGIEKVGSAAQRFVIEVRPRP